MGYEIIYKTFTIKKDDTYIPFTIIGSNNCYEMTYNGRERRERNLHNASFFFNHKHNFKSLSEMDKHFQSQSIQKEMNGGMIQGRYSTAKGLLKSFKKYIFDVDEISLNPQLTNLYYMEIKEEEKTRIEKRFREELKDIDYALTEKEKQDIINKCLDDLDLDEKTEKELMKYKRDNLIIYGFSEYGIENAFRDKYSTRNSRRFITKEEKQKAITSKHTVSFDSEMSDDDFNKKIEQFIGKQVILESNGNLLRGRIKKAHNGHIGFFRYRMKRRYNPLSKHGFGYAQLKVDRLVDIKKL